MLDITSSDWRVQTAPPPQAARLVLGRPTAEALALVPRLFSLCREAQGAALAAALDGPAPDIAAWRREILRDHLLKLCITLPEALGGTPAPLPSGWDAAGPDLARTLFGPAGRLPDPTDLDGWLASETGIGGTLGALAARFTKGEAVAEGLSPPQGAETLAPSACENSVAGRHMSHPVMRRAEKTHGRGPLWRALARAVEIEALIDGWTPAAERHGDIVLAPAARGTYALRTRVTGGLLTAFDRTTPTDHLLAPGGILARSLATLRPDREALAPLLLDVLDPCIPVRLKGSGHA